MILAVRSPAAPTGQKVDGTLTVYGAELHHHGHFVSCALYGILDAGSGPRCVRTTLSAYKVDVLVHDEMFTCFSPEAAPWLEALSQETSLTIKGATLLPSGDLLPDGKVSKGKPAKILEVTAKTFGTQASGVLAGPGVSPLDRHPIHLAEPIHLAGYKVKPGPILDLGDGVELPVAMARVSYASVLKEDHVNRSSEMAGLLRFDGSRWSIHPLAVRTTGKTAEVVFTGQNAVSARTAKRKVDTLAVLRGFAGRLLRAKA